MGSALMDPTLMDSTNTIWSFIVAVLLGFLIGLEREKKRETRGSIFAGVRTFPLISLFGAITGLLTLIGSALIAPVGFAAFALLLGLAYWRASAQKVGGTSEVAALVAFGLGLLAGLGAFTAALAGAVLTTAVLSLHEELHSLAGSLSREDMFASLQFAAVSLIILPLVPDAAYGPWGVWNPRTIWILVVLISGISFVGYVATKVIGTERGIGLSGLLGGLASSTAVTLSFSERSRANPKLDLVLAVGVLAASTVMVPRLLLLLSVVQPALILPALPALLVLFAVTVTGWYIAYRGSSRQSTAGATLHNPFELVTAIKFAVVFGVVLLLARAAQEFLGERGVYLASTLAGLTQMDAITLTLGAQVDGGLDLTVAARGLVLAAAGNSLFKAVLAFFLGSRGFGRTVLATLVLAALAAVATAWLVPLTLFAPR
jgi:uncharacterized membrane protein (DUF4010 family)